MDVNPVWPDRHARRHRLGGDHRRQIAPFDELLHLYRPLFHWYVDEYGRQGILELVCVLADICAGDAWHQYPEGLLEEGRKVVRRYQLVGEHGDELDLAVLVDLQQGVASCVRHHGLSTAQVDHAERVRIDLGRVRLVFRLIGTGVGKRGHVARHRYFVQRGGSRIGFAAGDGPDSTLVAGHPVGDVRQFSDERAVGRYYALPGVGHDDSPAPLVPSPKSGPAKAGSSAKAAVGNSSIATVSSANAILVLGIFTVFSL